MCRAQKLDNGFGQRSDRGHRADVISITAKSRDRSRRLLRQPSCDVRPNWRQSGSSKEEKESRGIVNFRPQVMGYADDQPRAELSGYRFPPNIIGQHLAVSPCAVASCREDDGRPVEFGCQEPASNHPKRLSLRVVVRAEDRLDRETTPPPIKLTVPCGRNGERSWPVGRACAVPWKK